jgi:Secretion system C-terminal sorting domain
LNTAFNKNTQSIVIGQYAHNQAPYPFLIQNCVFTSRNITTTAACNPPNWITTTQLLAASPVADNLETPYKLADLAFVPLTGVTNPDGKPNSFIALKKVGYSGGSQTALVTRHFSFNTVDVNLNLFDNGNQAIQAENSNYNVSNAVLQNCNIGILGWKNGTAPNNSGQIPHYSAITIATNIKNRYFNNKYGILSAGYSYLDLQGNDFRTTNNISSYGLNSWPPVFSTNLGHFGMLILGGTPSFLRIQNNEIYNHLNGICISANLSGSIANIMQNKIWDKPAGNSTTTPYCTNAITMDGTYPKVTIMANPFVNVQSNNIKDAFGGINMFNYKNTQQQINVQDNTIVLKVDPNTNILGSQHGIWVANTNNLYVKNNNVKGILPNTSLIYSDLLMNNTLGFKGRQSNYRLDNNINQVITCNTSNIGSFGFEFNGPTSAVGTKWINGNIMTGSHYYGLFLNNGVLLGAQNGGTNVPTGNSFTFTPTNNAQHTYTYNCNAIWSPMTVNSGLPWQPTINAANNLLNRYNTGNNSIVLSATIAPTGCAVPPVLPVGPTYTITNGGGVGSLLNGGVVYTNKNIELNYMAKMYIYQWLNNEPGYITGVPELTSFYNEANALTSPYRKMKNIEADIAAALYSSAQTMNNAFVPSIYIETNHKNFYDIQIKYLSGTAITAADKTELLRIALECPHTDGAIVYDARSLYNIIAINEGQALNTFTDDCNPSGLFRQAESIKEQEFDVEIYPNPSTGKFFIALPESKTKAIAIGICNILGQKVSEHTLLIDNGVAPIHLQLLPGLYFITVTNEKYEKVTKTITIK